MPLPRLWTAPSIRSTRRFSRFAGASAGLIALAGCAAVGGDAGSNAPGRVTAAAAGFTGMVHGGQQPIAHAQVALYAAGKSGIASAARSTLTASVATAADGSFNLTGLYSCQPGDELYIVATGGDAGSGVNPAIAMTAALGSCSALQANAATTFITIDEVTTVASVYALTAFMTGAQNLGTDSAHTNALIAAFANVGALASTVSGYAFQTSLGNGIVPQTTIDSLANSLAACVNSVPSSSVCANLFSATTVSGSTPADTLQATINLAQNPALNTGQIFSLATAAAPFQPTLTSAPPDYTIAVAHPSDVLTFHNDNGRTGVQSHETLLTPTNVNSTQFGKIFTFTMDGDVFAQPLYVGGVGMPDGALHNVVLDETSKGVVYVFDADGGNSLVPLWQQSLVPAGEHYATAATDYGITGCNNPPAAGVIGTPVVDRSTQTIYLVTKTATNTDNTNIQRIHAISLLDGTENPGSPQVISPSFQGTGDGSTNGIIPFSAARQNQRAALLLTSHAGQKNVWVAFASHCDKGPYHGVIVGYDATNLAHMTAAYNNTPNGGLGGIWLGAGGLVADPDNYIYALGGNGTFDANTGGPDYGDTVQKLQAAAPGSGSILMSVADYFTPSNQQYLMDNDLDVGGSEPILIHDPASGVAPYLLLANDKAGYVYLLNTANMGTYDTGTNGVDGLNGDIQDFYVNGGLYNRAFFNNTLYTTYPVNAYPFTPGTATTAGSFSTTPLGNSPAKIDTPPVISANGTSNALVWLHDPDGVLGAYTAPAFVKLYTTSDAANSRDIPVGWEKFTSPIIANGKVYLSGVNGISVYGLLN